MSSPQKIHHEETSFEERQLWVGLALAILGMVVYVGVVLTRALTDDLPLRDVAWHAPMLWVLFGSIALYGSMYGIGRLQQRGTASDERDADINRYGESVGGGVVGMTVLVSIILLALDIDPFWVAHNLFFGCWFGSLVGGSSKAAAYREGIPS